MTFGTTASILRVFTVANRMKINSVAVCLNLSIQFIIATTSSLSSESFDLVREISQAGDRFKISIAETNQNKCVEHGAHVRESGNGSRQCQCPPYKPTFWFNNGKWRCSNDTAIRSIEGCGVFFLNETKTSSLAVVDISNPKVIEGISHNPLNRSLNCGLDTPSCAYLGCSGEWITSPTNENAWRSFSIGLKPLSSKLNLTITDGISTALRGSIIKLVFSDGCAFSNSSLRRCLIFKLPGKRQCKGTPNEQIPTDPSGKVNVHPKEKNPCKTYWNKELSVVVISAVSVVVVLIIVIIVLVVILQRRRMKEELMKVLQDVEVNASETSGSLRYYVDMTEAQSQLPSREQSTQTEKYIFTFGEEEPDYASIRKINSTPTTSDGSHYYNIAPKVGESHDYATLRWHGLIGAAGKVPSTNNVATREESNELDDEEAAQSSNVASNKGRYKDLQQELIQLVRESEKQRSNKKLQEHTIGKI